MDTIKSYLETMFANLPATTEVLKAKDELWGMMEDKYNELISEGKSENEAVGSRTGKFPYKGYNYCSKGLDRIKCSF